MGSEIAVSPSGKFLYASNRGHNSIVIFAIDSTDGSLKDVSWTPTKGKRPRFFTFDSSGSLLYVANQDSDSIVFFRVDNQSGQLTPTGQTVETGSPVCIVFAYH